MFIMRLRHTQCENFMKNIMKNKCFIGTERVYKILHGHSVYWTKTHECQAKNLGRSAIAM